MPIQSCGQSFSARRGKRHTEIGPLFAHGVPVRDRPYPEGRVQFGLVHGNIHGDSIAISVGGGGGGGADGGGGGTATASAGVGARRQLQVFPKPGATDMSDRSTIWSSDAGELEAGAYTRPLFSST